MLLAVLIIPMGLPGTFLIVANALIYGWITGFAEVTWAIIGFLLLIAVLAEGIEFGVGMATAGKYGASRQGIVGAIIGGFAGAILGTPMLPLVGTVVGAFVGTFVGATLFEFFTSRDLDKSIRVGFGAFLGALGGKLAKISAATAMVVTVVLSLVQ